MSRLVLFPAMALAALISACAAPPPRRSPLPQPAQPAGDTNVLTGTQWLLASLNGQPALADAQVTLAFNPDGRAGGRDGCNNYSTTYTVSGSSLIFGKEIMSTMMACAESIMAQAAAYTKALVEVASYDIGEGKLALKNAGGATLLTFEAQSTSLAGTSWEAIAVNNGKQAVVSLIIGTRITANFGTDGKIAGSVGCNNYTGPFTTDGASVNIGPLASTRKLCATPEGVMEQETQYLAALESAATYRMDGDRLELRTAEGALAVNFTRAPVP